MKREILISATQREIRVAILEDEQLVELQVDRPENKRMVGDIYLGKVEAVLPGIQAAFVNIGTEKAAFLHNSDLVYDEGGDDDDDDEGDDEESGGEDAADAAEAEAAGESAAEPKKKGGRGRGGRRRRKDPPKIEDVLKRGQPLIVQVSKEPISTKGPRVTAQVSLAGRFLVYMPFASRVGVSRKIGVRAERQRLREQVQSVLPKDKGGVIVRTVGEDVTQETFTRELQTLIGQWDKINKKQKFVGSPPKLLHRETSLTRGIIRDLFSTKVDRLTVDSKQVYNEIVEYLKGIAPELIDRVQLYEDKVPLFDTEGVETEIRDLFKRRCDLPSGGYLIIEPTEALVSIDVNSGRFTGKKDPEKTVTKTNMEAAKEIARQLRLRDVGGIVVCDFIDMETKANRDRVLQELRTHLGRDRARTKAYAVSDLGLIEMTRQRVRQSHFHAMTEPCPTCQGTGRVFTAETIVRRMERAVRRLASEGRRDPIVIKFPPDVAFYVLQQEKELVKRLEKGVGFSVEMRDDPLLKPDEFKLVVKGAGRDITSQYAVA
ncbi:MAG: Rne/Rng family ribonuclease [Gemmatimonadota bacterium]|jgi:ribonuclease G|nr:Rne/Rng family ribonuclease [Gemmatimonadota bacterium]MDQ8150331.1 Rne/Rng family ribonuclease [Gemmatimonadota bacterium]MDQ8151995.1 Rne/Rng family ribonuclease [Gemmatimonadota bacterium]MDQ8178089.1 Rne/Rng family ribonuclease [Gemmatimonadota bacterium]